MECLTFSPEQFTALLDYLFLYVFLAVLSAFVVWGGIEFLLRRLVVILRAKGRQLKRQRRQAL